jgi:peptidoglycan/LPS O-acetylase OafA/YrhL
MRPRLLALDGLRGMAALVVLIHHVLLTDAHFADPYSAPHPYQEPVYVRVLTYTPLHLVWNGTVAVYIFFVLSGYVLALPTVESRRESWFAYYPKRLIRLYLPVLAAVLLALLWMRVAPRHTSEGASWWLNAHPAPTADGIVRDVSLIVLPGITNSALWSLRWEVIFSVLLPLFIISIRWLRRFPAPLACLLLAGFTASAVPEWLTFLPMFGCGVALAWCGPMAVPTAGWARWLLLGAVVVGLNASWTPYLFADASGTMQGPLRVVEVLAACALVIVALQVPIARRILSRSVLLWLGSRSFSLYLVHEPIAVSLALLLGGRPPVLVTLMFSIPLALLVAEVFFRVVERPSLRLARIAGQRAQNRVQRETPTPATAEASMTAEFSISS